jgi:deoxycytidine triphosphate deaminase
MDNNTQAMFLNIDEIKQRNVINNAVEGHFRNAGYDLTIGSIIDMDGKSLEDFKLKPQGMIYVVFKEELKIPSNLIAFAHVKTSLTRRGIMATHIGIIDPLYEGYISTLLINFGSTDCYISKGNPALRLTFSSVKESPNMTKPEVKSLEKYLNQTKENTDHLEDKFLNLNSVEKEVSEVLLKRFFGILAIFGVGSFLVAMYFQFKASKFGDTERSIKRYETELNTLQEQNKTLDQRLERLQQSIEFKPTSDSSIKNNRSDSSKNG